MKYTDLFERPLPNKSHRMKLFYHHIRNIPNFTHIHMAENAD